MKIKTIRLQNFQSHEDSFFELSSNINIIKGSSYSGKSAFIRALDFFFYGGRIDESYVRRGEDIFKIEITLNDDTVIIREKGDKYNRFVIKKEGVKDGVYENFGLNIPDSIKNLFGIKEVYYDKDKSLKLNITNQFDPVFLFSETGSNRSKVLGVLTGSNLIGIALRDLSRDVKNLQQEIDYNNLTLNRYKQEETQYEDLPEQETLLEQSKKIYDHCKKLEENLLSIKNLLIKLVNNKKETEIQKSKQIDINWLQDIQDRIDQLIKIKEVSFNYNNVIQEYEQVKIKVYDISILDKYLEMITNLTVLKQIQEKVTQNFSSISILIQTKNKFIQDYENEINEYKVILLQNKNCPTCGQEVNEEVIQKHLKEL